MGFRSLRSVLFPFLAVSTATCTPSSSSSPSSSLELARAASALAVESEGPDYVPGELIVKLRSDFSGSPDAHLLFQSAGFTEAVELFDRSAQRNPELDHIYRVRVPESADLGVLVRNFSSSPLVRYAQPNFRVHTAYVPNDPYYSSSGTFDSGRDDLWGLKLIDVSSAWDVTFGEGVLVAVVDTGLDYGHAEIAPNVWTNFGEIPGNDLDDDGNGRVDDVRGWNFVSADGDVTDRHGHGTHVAGTIAAVGDNALGVIGVAPRATVMPVKAIGDSGDGEMIALAEGILYAAENGAQVINNSWICSYECPRNPVVEDVVRDAHALGAALVFAAGDHYRENIARYSPQNIPQAIVVGGQYHATFSNIGASLDVIAPSGFDEYPSATRAYENILSLRAAESSLPALQNVGTTFYRMRGTSMAAAHVSGVAALVLEHHPTWSNEMVRAAMRTNSDVPNLGFDRVAGHGMVNAGGAVSSFTPPSVLIRSPRNGQILDTTQLEIHGMVGGAGLTGWSLEYGVGAQGVQPAVWTVLTSGGASADGLLYTWNISNLPDDQYQLRLAARVTGTTRVYESRAFIDTSGAALAAFEQPVRRGAIVEIFGTAASYGFSGYSIEIVDREGLALPGALVTLSNGGTQRVVEGLLGYWDTTGAPAEHYSVVLHENAATPSEARSILTVVDTRAGFPIDLNRMPVPPSMHDHLDAVDLDGDGTLELMIAYGPRATMIDHRGLELPGWPQTLDLENIGRYTYGGVAVADLDGDGTKEVFSNIENDALLWNAQGELLPELDTYSPPLAYALADVDANGVNDIVGTSSGFVWVTTAAGQMLPGFPVRPATMPFTEPAVGDVDLDGKLEIAFNTQTNPSELYLLGWNGAVRSGWPRPVGPFGFEQRPAMADLDGDGDYELILPGFAGVVYAFHHTGTNVSGWPIAVAGADQRPMSAVAVGDLDGDGSPEVVSGTRREDANGVTVNALYAWRSNGVLLPGWPKLLYSFVDDVYSEYRGCVSPAIGDVDGDGRADVVVSCDDYREAPYALHAFRYDGTEVVGFPKVTFETGFTATTPVIADLDGDGFLNVAWIDDRKLLYVWDTPSPSTSPTPWPMFRRDAALRSAPVRSAPDFVVTQFSGPASGSVGGTISVSSTIRNDGGPGAASVAGFYLSTDPAISPSDLRIGSRSIAVLASNAASAGNTSVTIPASTLPGTYTLGAFAEDQRVLIETDETNNARAAGSITVSSAYDLSWSSVSAPAFAIPGRPQSYPNTVWNRGTAAVPAFSVGYYLSTDDVITSSDLLMGSRALTSLSANGTSAASPALTLPANTPPGNYYWGVIADVNGQIGESNETNNTRSSAIVVGFPNIQVSSVSGPASIAPSLNVILYAELRNVGTVREPAAFQTTFYLSNDATITTADRALGSASTSGLNAGANTVASLSVALPSNLAQGIYYFGAITDSGNVSSESDETDNIGLGNSASIAFDLLLSSVTVPASIAENSPVLIANSVQNPGSGVSAPFVLAAYLSTDAVITTSDTLLGSRTVNSIAAGATYTSGATYQTPGNLVTGTHYIGEIIDPQNSIQETDETNNVLPGRSTIKSSDLTVVAFTHPASVVAGLQATFTYDIRNIGAGISAVTYSRIYFSTDPVITSQDIQVATITCGQINPGASCASTNYQPVVSGSVPLGSYYVGLIADDNRSHPETDETNNVFTSGSQVHIGPDLVPTALTSPASVVAGSWMTINDTALNQGIGMASGGTVRFYFSPDATVTSADYLLGSRSLSTVAAGASSSASSSILAPTLFPTGTYYLGSIITAGAELDLTNNTRVSATQVTLTSNDRTAPTISLAQEIGNSIVWGTTRYIAQSSDTTGVARLELYDDATLLSSVSSPAASHTFSIDTRLLANGPRTISVRAYDWAGNNAVATRAATVSNLANNTPFNATSLVPACSSFTSCDTGDLVRGRGAGMEIQAPNTIAGTCTEVRSGAYRDAASLDRLRIWTNDGTSFGFGKTVTIEATVWSRAASDRLDLYYTSSVASPSWTLIATLTPPAIGEVVLSTTYVLPSSNATHAIRGNFRASGAAGSCTSGANNDRDDLIFLRP